MLSRLHAIADSVGRFVAAAWVDTRTGAVLVKHVVHDEAFVAPALDAATEVMRSPERPPRMVLLSTRHVHIIQRLTRDPHRVLVVICERSPNLGLACALVRAQAEAEDAC